MFIEEYLSLHRSFHIPGKKMAAKAAHDRLGMWTVLLSPDANIDRRKAKRTVPMEVLSLGLPRTGTASMQEAYAILGFQEPYHFASIVMNIRDADMWIEALNAKFKGIGKPYGKKEFDQLLGHCGAVTDTPCCFFWEELIEAYPEAKVVLVERDEQKWLESFSILLEGSLNPFGRYVLRYTDPLWYGRIINPAILWIEGFTGSTNLKVAKRNSLSGYRKHYELIRDKLPQDRLLNYQLGSGWQPLCEFLGRDVPNVPFPHKNEAEELANAFKVLVAKSLKRSAVSVIAVAVFLGCVAKLLLWSRT